MLIKKNVSSALENIVINVKKQQIPELSPSNFPEFSSVRNPAAFTHNNQVGLLYTVRHISKETGKTESYLHIAKSDDGENFKLDKTPFIGLNSDAKCAVEDSRVTKIDDKYHITFTAYNGEEKDRNITRIGYATTKDFETLKERQVIINEKGNNKNALLFSKDKNNYYIIDRPFNNGPVNEEKPSAEIGIISKDFKTYKNLGNIIAPREGKWDSKRVGINTPPIRTNLGNIFLYHGVQEKNNVYNMGLIITDEKDPQKILYRSEQPILTPTKDFETGQGKMKAEVPNVIFGCGVIPFKNEKAEEWIRFYYSGADRYPAFADIKIEANGKPLKILDDTFKI